ncbi:MAG: carboxy terminal-processing peptidase [Bacteroidales bacterium]|nr:carboxy terminal-processing peptidase [Bacteroidales bacterium]
MNLKKIIPVSVVLISAIFLGAFFVYENNEPKEKLIIATSYEILKSFHYSPQNLDDTYSERVFNLYMKSLDYNKMFFTKDQIDILSSYKTKIDDEIKSSSLDFFNLSIELLDKQIDKIQNLYQSVLEKPFDYNVKESINLNTDKREYCANQSELTEYWTKYLKYQVLTEIVSIENEQKKLREESDTATLKTESEIEKEAREKIIKRYETRFKRMKKISRNDRFSSYVNAMAGAFDPHTNYFPPTEKEDFDISMSGKLEGIGATLSEKDGYIKVVEIVPGSPSWKQGELKAEDIILKVAQGDNEPVEIIDMRLDEAVRLIRGPKGTKVVLTVKKIDGTVVQIPIIRDVIVLEEKYAKSTVITTADKKAYKIGYIYLPQFYTDMNDPRGRKCSKDIEKEVIKLKNANVDGIIIDLRNNGGGSLNDVVEIGGLFIPEGPIVQVKSMDSSPKLYLDRDGKTLYDGPLAIMVNTFSASASEILAAAMQDYKRAIIIGTESTYGKGTVQRIVDIDRLVSSEYQSQKPLGAIKITIQKFYRIDGGTTQFQGVKPDIILPDLYDKIDIGEKELDYPLQWSEVKSSQHMIWPKAPNIKDLAKKSAARTQKDSSFLLIKEAAKWLSDTKDQESISLEINTFRKKSDEDLTLSKKYKNAGKASVPLEVLSNAAGIDQNKEKENSTLDSVACKRIEDWNKSIKEDVTLYEAYQIISDMIKSLQK